MAAARWFIISLTDQPLMALLGEVMADLLRRIGMQVNLVATDWGSVLARRASREPSDEGGWNIFQAWAVAREFASPASHLGLHGTGNAGWAGWFGDARMGALRTDWFAAPGATAERAITGRLEQEAFEQVPYVPLG